MSFADEAAPAGQRWPIKRLLLVLGLAATAYAAALLWVDARSLSWPLLWSGASLQAAALSVLSYVLRGLRWRLWMAHASRPFGLLEGLRLYWAGYAFTPTPGNVGEALRGLLLARQPLPMLQSLAIFGAERLADLLCLLLLCLPALGWLLNHAAYQAAFPTAFQGGTAGWWLAGLLGAAAGLVSVAVVWRNRALVLRRLPWLQGTWDCLAVRPLVWFALTLSAWAAQGMAVWLICRALDVPMQVLTAIGFYAVAMVAGALSALPAGLGSMELVFAGLLVAQSATTAEALTITVMVRLLTLWPAVGLGVAALSYSVCVAKDIRL